MRKKFQRFFETLACGLGFHVWTRWMDHRPHNPVPIKTRTCKICGYSQVK